MASPISKNFDNPDEVRQMTNGQVEIVSLGEVMVMRLTLNPGWKWSTSVKPIVETESCQVHHIGYQVSGRIMARMDDGLEVEYGPGAAYNIPPGHDAWVIGSEPVVSLDFRGAETYAKPQE